MGALANSAQLINSTDFLGWCIAASCYQARLVITESVDTPEHAVRLELAKAVINDPMTFSSRVVTVIGTDPSVVTAGGTVANLSEAAVLTSIATAWTVLAKIYTGEV
jgi:hypothetical protein